jgi:hypothetical protein
MEKVNVTAEPTSGGDITLTVYKLDGSDETKVGGTNDGGGAGEKETVELSRPPAGKYRAYVDNWATQPNADWWKATVHYTGIGGGERGTSSYTDEQYKAYIAKLRSFVDDGGNLVLTDGALQALPDLFGTIKQTDVSRATSYTGQIAFTKVATTSQDPKAEGNTLADPLAKNVVQPGARFNTGLRRQTYEPTPIGFAIQDEGGGDFSTAGVWQVARKSFEAAGGRIVGTSVTSSPRSATVVADQVAYGELKIGKGVVRILGALVPQPTEQFDHQEGLEPYAVTYTGSFLGENITDWCKPGRNCIDPRTSGSGGSGSSGNGGPGGPGTASAACVDSRSFRKAAVRSRGKGLRFSFKRRGTSPVRVDLFQVSKGRRVLREHLVGRFTSRRAINWNGKKVAHFAPTDGYYFARFRVKAPTGFFEFKRVALKRKNGHWTKQRQFFRTAGCGLVRQYKLSRMVFGGSNGRRLGASVLLARSTRVVVTMSHGKKTVARKTLKRAPAGKVVRLKFPKKGLKKGLYRVTIVAGRGKSAVRAKLYSRRI